MYPEPGTGSGQPFTTMIIPNRPAADPDEALASSKPSGLLHRTLGRGNPTRRIFANGWPSRRAIAAAYRAGRRYTAARSGDQEPNPQDQVVLAPTSVRRLERVSRRLRRPISGVAIVMCALAMGLGATSAAQAQVNPNGPHAYFVLSDCTITLGNVAWSGSPTGAAVGGADITCAHYHSYIGAIVYLWRWDISRGSWVNVSTGTLARSNAYSLSDYTTKPYCGGGSTWWDDKVTVWVDSYSATFDLGTGLGYYPAYSPGYFAGC